MELAEYLRDIHHQPEQVQDFYPTPSTLSTVMYYTGVDPRTLQGTDLKSMKKVYVPVDPHEKAMQRALMQFRNPKLYSLVKEALVKAGREDLIGYGPKCLIRPSEDPAVRGRGTGLGKGASGGGRGAAKRGASGAGRGAAKRGASGAGRDAAGKNASGDRRDGGASGRTSGKTVSRTSGRAPGKRTGSRSSGRASGKRTGR